jgi:hypothetical protein
MFLIGKTISRKLSSIFITSSIIHIPYRQSKRSLIISNVRRDYFYSIICIKHIIYPSLTRKNIQIKFTTIIDFTIFLRSLSFNNWFSFRAITSFRIEVMQPIKIFHVTFRHRPTKSRITTTLFTMSITQ